MNVEELLVKADSNQNELSHYGVPNQKWGVRRYQNEDGTLTAEGRKHYGLNPKYANLSDDDMRKTLNTARAKSEYVGLMTEGSRKRSASVKGLVSSSMKLAKTGTNALSTVTSDRQKKMDTKLGAEDKELDTKLKDMKSAYDAEKKVYDSIKNDPAKASEKAAFEKKWAAEAKEVTAMNDRRNAISEEKAGYKQSAEAAKANADLTKKAVDTANSADLSGSLGSLAANRQYQAERQQALSNLEEIDPDDLQAMINRIKLEKEYDALINPPQPTLGEKIKKGIDSVDHWLALGLTILQVKNALEKKRSTEAKHSDLSDYELAHAGVKGMKKGVRRYQNEDGSLTAEGYRHYGIDPNWNPQKQETPEQKEKRVRKEIEANYRTKALKAKYETQAERARSKEVERQIKRENKLEIDRQKQLYKLQNQQTKRELDIQNEAKADNRKNVRKNFMKALVGSAVVGMLVAKGIHNMRMDTLMTKNAHEMDMLKEEGRTKLKGLKIETKGNIELEDIKQRGAVEVERAKTQGVVAEADAKKYVADRELDIQKDKTNSPKLQEQNERYKKALGTLGERNKGLKKDAEDANTRASNAETARDDAVKARDTAVKAQQDAEGKSKELERELKETENNLSEAVDERQLAEKSAKEAQERQQAAEDNAREQEKARKAAEQERDEAAKRQKAAEDAARKEAEQRLTEQSKAEETVRKATEERDAAQQAQQSAQETAARLTKERDKALEENKFYENRNAELAEEARTANQNAAALQKKYDQTKEDLEAANGINSTMTEQAKAYRIENGNLKDELATATYEKNEISAKLHQEEQRAERNMDTIQKQKKQLSETEKGMEDLKKRFAEALQKAEGAEKARDDMARVRGSGSNSFIDKIFGKKRQGLQHSDVDEEGNNVIS